MLTESDDMMQTVVYWMFPLSPLQELVGKRVDAHEPLKSRDSSETDAITSFVTELNRQEKTFYGLVNNLEINTGKSTATNQTTLDDTILRFADTVLKWRCDVAETIVSYRKNKICATEY